MNYISEINEFYDWLETNESPKAAIALWHALMHINNKARWQPIFSVAISSIESKTGFKRSELYKARNYLQQKGLIRWKERGGNLSAEYQIVPFSVHTVGTNGNANGNTNGETNGNTNGTINKLNQTKQEETRPPPVFNFLENQIYDVEAELLKNQILFEGICMAAGRTAAVARTALRKFHLHLEENNRYPGSRKALFAGFEKWLMNERPGKSEEPGDVDSVSSIEKQSNELLDKIEGEWKRKPQKPPPGKEMVF